MTIHFQKYQGTGNDFIMINAFTDDQAHEFLDQKKIAHLCNRHFGIGADGLIIIAPSSHCDFKMIYYNSDGRESSMCGNGGRCACRFAHLEGIVKNECSFEAIDGIHRGIIADEVAISMIDVSILEDKKDHVLLNTGSPHAVFFVEELDQSDFVEKAKAIRYSQDYADKGVNVNFVKADQRGLEMRTYERGVEDETLSCGTGVVAAALAAHSKKLIQSHRVSVKTKGGHLTVSFTSKADNKFEEIFLEGPVGEVFSGTMDI